MAPKITIIGAGSGVFSLNLIKDICLNEKLKDSTLALMDVDVQRLDSIYGLALRYIEETHHTDLKVLKTIKRTEALKGADFVINVALDFGHKRLRDGWDVAFSNGYRFGGSQHIVHDEAFWVNFYQVRLMESILQDALAICPNAYYILVANPVQMGVTYLSRKYPQAKIVGMCHGYNGVRQLSRAMGLDYKDVMFEVSGVNHFIWLSKFFCKGKDAYPLLDDWIRSGKATSFSRENPSVSIGEGPKALDLFDIFGLFPIGDTSTPGGGSWGWWYHTDEVEESYHENPRKWYDQYFEHCYGNVERIKKAVEDRSTPVSKVFSALASDEPMVPLIEALSTDSEKIIIVNIPNKGSPVSGIPEDYEVEVSALVSKRGIQPIQANPLPKTILAHIWRDYIAPVEMEIEAFTSGNRRYLLDLIMMDPWTKSKSQAENLLRDILALPCNKEMKNYYGKKV